MFTQFPQIPNFKGEWRAIQLEPIIGSGERITVAISVLGQNGEHKAIQAIRPELLECLYGNKSKEMMKLIQLIIESVSNQTDNLQDWKPPFEGLTLSKAHHTSSKDIYGILRQAIQLSSSLSKLSLAAEHHEENISEQVKKAESRWSASIENEVITKNNNLRAFFNVSAKIGNSEIKTRFNFLTDNYASNFAVFNPHSASQSTTVIKSKLIDLERLEKAQGLFNIEKRELILGLPDFKNDVSLSDKAIKNAENYLIMYEEIALSQEIEIFKTSTPTLAAKRLMAQVA